MTPARPLHIGLLCTELFDPRIGGFGGFGFAALRLVEVLGAAGPDRMRFTALLPVPTEAALPAEVHGVRVVGPSGDLAHDLRTYRALELDLVVAIDWDPRFVVPLAAVPTDGPGTSDPSALETLEPADNPRGGRSLRWFLASANATRRRVEVAVPTIGLRDAVRGQYGVDPRRLWQLGTPLPTAPPRADRREARAHGRTGGSPRWAARAAGPCPGCWASASSPASAAGTRSTPRWPRLTAPIS